MQGSADRARFWMGEWFQLPALGGSQREKNSNFCSRKRTSLFLSEHINVTIDHRTEYFVMMMQRDLSVDGFSMDMRLICGCYIHSGWGPVNLSTLD
jgi:hypothetical protein